MSGAKGSVVLVVVAAMVEAVGLAGLVVSGVVVGVGGAVVAMAAIGGAVSESPEFEQAPLRRASTKAPASQR